jgi:hypothetical protein
MKGKMVVGALVLSVALASQAFANELFGSLAKLGGDCKACAPAACAPAPKCCAPEPKACGGACEGCRQRGDLFRGLKDLFSCDRCGRVNCRCEKACEAPKACAAPKACKPCEAPKACAVPKACKPCEAPKACAAPKACEPSCKACEPARKVRACKPAGCEKVFVEGKQVCCEKAAVGEPCGCRKRLGNGLVLGMLDNLFACRKCDEKAACGGCDVCGATGAKAPAAAAAAPAKAPEESKEAAPLPVAPKADPSASLMRHSLRTIAQN